MRETKKQALIERALKVSEKNLASGNWNLETAQLFNRMAFEQPEDILKMLE